MIKNIVFDMGNVVIRFDPDAFIERFGVGGEDKKTLLLEIFRSPEWVMMDRGRLTDEQCADVLCPRVPEHLRDVARKLIALWDRPIIEIEGIYPLIEELKGLGYSRIKFLCLISAPVGISRFEREHPEVPVFTAARDERLNSHFYIVPGLGDAGDRIFGTL